MSVYTNCADAARELMADPDRRVVSQHAPEGIFTDLDVIMLAARDEPWRGHTAQNAWMKKASREASQVMTYLFQRGEVVRFGPVVIPGLGDPDYVRITTRVAYASIDGPSEIQTPNGTFARVTLTNDFGRPGRRLGHNRDDLELWERQEIAGYRGLPGTPIERKVASLEAENEALRQRVHTLEQENQRLRGVRSARTRGRV